MDNFRNEQFKNLCNKRVLVTGGAGFIGSNLCEVLLQFGVQVVCLDNFSTGFMHNIEKFLGNNNFTLIEGDIRDLKTCEKACFNIDFVLHHAALGSVPRSIKDPISSNEVNVTGFLNMLIAAVNNGVKRFIYAASSSTYGDSKILPKLENQIGKPLSPYAVTKYVNELYADVFSKTYNIKTMGLRYFNVFGKRQNPDGAYAAVIPLFVKNLLNLESPIINGDGSNSRDFTYIDNVIYMNLLCISSDNEDSLNQVYNTAVGENTNLNSLFDLIKEKLLKYFPKVKSIKPIYGPPRIGDVAHSLASIEKAKEFLNYSPIVRIEQGIEESIKYYIDYYKKDFKAL